MFLTHFLQKYFLSKMSSFYIKEYFVIFWLLDCTEDLDHFCCHISVAVLYTVCPCFLLRCIIWCIILIQWRLQKSMHSYDTFVHAAGMEQQSSGRRLDVNWIKWNSWKVDRPFWAMSTFGVFVIYHLFSVFN